MGTKTCSVCKHAYPLENFYNSATSKDGKGYRCKPCDAKERAASRARSSGKTAEGYRKRKLMLKYGLTMDRFNEMLSEQGGRCAICGTDNPRGEGKMRETLTFSFSVDHCHVTGRVRGLLCHMCNRGLGFFKDQAERLRLAAGYLDCH